MISTRMYVSPQGAATIFPSSFFYYCGPPLAFTAHLRGTLCIPNGSLLFSFSPSPWLSFPSRTPLWNRRRHGGSEARPLSALSVPARVGLCGCACVEACAPSMVWATQNHRSTHTPTYTHAGRESNQVQRISLFFLAPTDRSSSSSSSHSCSDRLPTSLSSHAWALSRRPSLVLFSVFCPEDEPKMNEEAHKDRKAQRKAGGGIVCACAYVGMSGML